MIEVLLHTQAHTHTHTHWLINTNIHKHTYCGVVQVVAVLVLPLPSHCLIEQNTLVRPAPAPTPAPTSTPTPASAFRACDHCMPGSCVWVYTCEWSCIHVHMYMCVCLQTPAMEWMAALYTEFLFCCTRFCCRSFSFSPQFRFFYNSCQSLNNDDDDADVDADDSNNDNSPGQLLYRLHMPLCLPHPLAFSPQT